MKKQKAIKHLYQTSIFVVALICCFILVITPFTLAYLHDTGTIQGSIEAGELDIVMSENSSLTTPMIIGETTAIEDSYGTGDLIPLPYAYGKLYLVNKGNLPGFIRIKVAALIGGVDYGQYISLNVAEGWTRSAVDHEYYLTSAYMSCQLPAQNVIEAASGFYVSEDIPSEALEEGQLVINITMKAIQTDHLAFVSEWDTDAIPMAWYKNRISGVGFRNYLQSSGAQYIDLGYKAGGQLSVETEITPVISTTQGIFGGRDGNTSNTYATFLMGNYFRMDYSETQTSMSSQPTVVTSNKYKIVRNKNTFKIINPAGTEYMPANYPAVSSFKGSYNLYLFAVNTAGTAGNFASIQMTYFKLKDGNKLVKYLVPAVDANNIPCMFDVINMVKYYSNSASQFTVSAT